MKKLIKFDSVLDKKIQAYADAYCDGNYTMAVRMILRQFFDPKEVKK